MVRAGWCSNLVAYQRRNGTVGAMADTARLRCTTTECETASFAEVVAAVYGGVAEPHSYSVELTAISASSPSRPLRYRRRLG